MGKNGFSPAAYGPIFPKRISIINQSYANLRFKKSLID
jgi:hypothetical protein